MLPRDDVAAGQRAEKNSATPSAQAPGKTPRAAIRDEMEAILAPQREAGDERRPAEVRARHAQAVIETPAGERTVLDEQICDAGDEVRHAQAARDSGQGAQGRREKALRRAAKRTGRVRSLEAGAAADGHGRQRRRGRRRRRRSAWCWATIASRSKKSSPAFPAFLGASEPSIVPPPERQSTGRRAALARWLTPARPSAHRAGHGQSAVAASLWRRASSPRRTISAPWAKPPRIPSCSIGWPSSSSSAAGA